MYYKTTNLAIILLSIGLIYSASGQTAVNQMPEPDYDKYRRERLSVGIAASYAYFNTSVTFLDKTENRTFFISPEGMLGLEKTQFIPTIYGFWHPAKRHWVGFSYFTIQREGSAVSVNRDFGNVNVNGNILMSDRSSFYYLSYNYLLFYDDRAFVLGALGLYGIHMRAEYKARGEIKIDNDPVESNFYDEKIDRWAPFPLIGLQVRFAITPKWYVGASASLIGGEYSGMSAFVFESKMLARYVIHKNISILGELMFFNAGTELDEEKQRTNARYSFTALFIGIDVGY